MKIKCSLTTGADSSIFTCIDGSAQRHAWGLGGWALRCYLTNTRNRKNGGNIYNARNCRISIVMKIFLL